MLSKDEDILREHATALLNLEAEKENLGIRYFPFVIETTGTISNIKKPIIVNNRYFSFKNEEI